MTAETASEATLCGLIMPISGSEATYPTSHWAEVQEIHVAAIKAAGFEPKPVWLRDETNIVHRTIVDNLFRLPVVLCDVSTRNPNVMFELGLRLAFDKPAVVVKDSETPVPFDIGVIEYIEYPQGLRHGEMEQFKGRLAGKLKATYDKSVEDPNFSQFLRHFADLTPKGLSSAEVSLFEYVDQRFEKVEGMLQRLLQPKKPKSTRFDDMVSLAVLEIEDGLGPVEDLLQKAAESVYYKFRPIDQDRVVSVVHEAFRQTWGTEYAEERGGRDFVEEWVRVQ